MNVALVALAEAVLNGSSSRNREICPPAAIVVVQAPKSTSLGSVKKNESVAVCPHCPQNGHRVFVRPSGSAGASECRVRQFRSASLRHKSSAVKRHCYRCAADDGCRFNRNQCWSRRIRNSLPEKEEAERQTNPLHILLNHKSAECAKAAHTYWKNYPLNECSKPKGWTNSLKSHERLPLHRFIRKSCSIPIKTLD